MDHIKLKAQERGKKVITVLLSEIFPHKLALMSDVGAWVQVACPRLDLFFLMILNEMNWVKSSKYLPIRAQADTFSLIYSYWNYLLLSCFLKKY